MARVFAGVVFDFGNVLYSVDYPAMARRLAADRAQEFYRGFVGSDLQVAYETGRAGLEEVLDGLAVQGFPTDEAHFLDAYLSIFSPVGGMGDLVGASPGNCRWGSSRTRAASMPGTSSSACPSSASSGPECTASSSVA